MKFSPALQVVNRQSPLAIPALALALLGLAFASLAMGRYPLDAATVANTLVQAWSASGHTEKSTPETIVLLVRLPRAVAAMAAGAGLALAGSHYQTIFRNPMASPALLGVSAGAGFGAALALLSRQPLWVVEAAGFCGGLMTVSAIFFTHRVIGGRSMVTLVLCGMAMSALFQALISLTKYVADPIEVLPSITFWLMGGLSKIDLDDALLVVSAVLLAGAPLYLLRWRICLLALGEDEAAALGVSVVRLRTLVILCATLISASITCVAGIVGWVGLLIPHIARMIVGLEPNRLFPATALLGAIFLLGVDDLARSLSVIEIPLGVLTSILGAPFFFFLLLRVRLESWA